MVIGIDMDDTICSTNELIIVQADKYGYHSDRLL